MLDHHVPAAATVLPSFWLQFPHLLKEDILPWSHRLSQPHSHMLRSCMSLGVLVFFN